MREKIKLKKLSFFLLVVFIFTSCKVTLVPAYDQVLADEISNTAKATDKLYLDMLDTPVATRTYDAFKDQYNAIESEISTIELKNEARPKNHDFLVIIKNLEKAFVEAKKYHKDHSTISDGEAIEYRGTLAAYWKPLYIAEKALK